MSITFCLISCKKEIQQTPGSGIQKGKSTPVIVILGSSTAAGVGATPIDSAWVNVVQATVNASGTKAIFYNLAVEDYTTYNVMPDGSNVPPYRPAPDTANNITKALSYKPALVMINLPTNDIADGYSYAEIMSNYQKLTAILDSAKVQYIIFSTQPRDFSTVSERMRLDTLNNEVIAAYANHVNNFLDQLSTPTFEIDSIYSSGDGIHLNDAGHRVIANATLKQSIFINVVQ